ncbi:hypothetical protein L3X38_023493 [Prunus dulcis]|uniref:Uncharacterized protein n=1 Tax=Prunus dulcis TaxID=3755 RepID=A0AAD4W0R1_PRUDU|nr:hypothetical protein L3X38_023493 [Prunus dulcis]
MYRGMCDEIVEKRKKKERLKKTILIRRSKTIFKSHPSVMGGGLGSYNGDNFMVKRTVDERENKLIFLDPIIILWVGDERRRSIFIGLSLWVRDGWRTQRSVVNKAKQAAAVKDRNNLTSHIG